MLNAVELEGLGRNFDSLRPEESWSLPARPYTDPSMVAIEREAIFARNWQFLCHAEKLREPGSYVTGMVAGKPVAAVLDALGKAVRS